jgi:RNA recognition motif-containing protein
VEFAREEDAHAAVKCHDKDIQFGDAIRVELSRQLDKFTILLQNVGREVAWTVRTYP